MDNVKNLITGKPSAGTPMTHPEHGLVVAPAGQFLDYFRRGYRAAKGTYVAGTNGQPDRVVYR